MVARWCQANPEVNAPYSQEYENLQAEPVKQDPEHTQSKLVSAVLSEFDWPTDCLTSLSVCFPRLGCAVLCYPQNAALKSSIAASTSR